MSCIPGSSTVNLAIDRFAGCRVRRAGAGLRVFSRDGAVEKRAGSAAELLADARTALVGSLLEALEIREPLEIEFWSGVPFGSGLGGSSALTVALMGALEGVESARSHRRRSRGLREGRRDARARQAGRRPGLLPAAGGGSARHPDFLAGRTTSLRIAADGDAWEKHLTLFDSGVSHSSGMNNWEILGARLEGDRAVAENLEGVRLAAEAMSQAVRALRFPGDGEGAR